MKLIIALILLLIPALIYGECKVVEYADKFEVVCEEQSQPNIKSNTTGIKSPDSKESYQTKKSIGNIVNRNDGYQTKDSFGNLVNNKDSYQTKDSFGNLVNSKDSYQTKDSFGNLVNSKDCYQTKDSFGNLVQSSGCSR